MKFIDNILKFFGLMRISRMPTMIIPPGFTVVPRKIPGKTNNDRFFPDSYGASGGPAKTISLLEK